MCVLTFCVLFLEFSCFSVFVFVELKAAIEICCLASSGILISATINKTAMMLQMCLSFVLKISTFFSASTKICMKYREREYTNGYLFAIQVTSLMCDNKYKMMNRKTICALKSLFAWLRIVVVISFMFFSFVSISFICYCYFGVFIIYYLRKLCQFIMIFAIGARCKHTHSIRLCHSYQFQFNTAAMLR